MVIKFLLCACRMRVRGKQPVNAPFASYFASFSYQRRCLIISQCYNLLSKSIKLTRLHFIACCCCFDSNYNSLFCQTKEFPFVFAGYTRPYESYDCNLIDENYLSFWLNSFGAQWKCNKEAHVWFPLVSLTDCSAFQCIYQMHAASLLCSCIICSCVCSNH